MDRLAVYNGQRLVEKVELGTDPINVGRDLSNRVALDDGAASRVHARLIPRGGRLLITDPGSTNGTYLNGERVPANTDVEVKPGDVVVIGTHRLILERTAEAVPRPPRKAAATQVLTAFAETMLGDMLRVQPKEPQTNEELETLARQAGARLIVCAQQGTVAYDIAKSRVKVGRASGSDIIIDHPSVSSSHAEIQLKGTRFHATDLKSTNKTKVDGTFITTKGLENHAAIQIGDIECLFESELPHRPGGERGNAEALERDKKIMSRLLDLLAAEAGIERPTLEQVRMEAEQAGVRIGEALVLRGAVTPSRYTELRKKAAEVFEEAILKRRRMMRLAAAAVIAVGMVAGLALLAWVRGSSARSHLAAARGFEDSGKLAEAEAQYRQALHASHFRYGEIAADGLRRVIRRQAEDHEKAGRFAEAYERWMAFEEETQRGSEESVLGAEAVGRTGLAEAEHLLKAGKRKEALGLLQSVIADDDLKKAKSPSWGAAIERLASIYWDDAMAALATDKLEVANQASDKLLAVLPKDSERRPRAQALDLYITARTQFTLAEREEAKRSLAKLFQLPISDTEWRALPFYAAARDLAKQLEVPVPE